MVFNGVPYKAVCTRNRPKVQFALAPAPGTSPSATAPDSGTTNPTSAADSPALGTTSSDTASATRRAPPPLDLTTAAASPPLDQATNAAPPPSHLAQDATMAAAAHPSSSTRKRAASTTTAEAGSSRHRPRTDPTPLCQTALTLTRRHHVIPRPRHGRRTSSATSDLSTSHGGHVEPGRLHRQQGRWRDALPAGNQVDVCVGDEVGDPSAPRPLLRV